MPLLSVITPIYNNRQTLERCIHSILQSTVDLELILVDDGSSDGSGEYCAAQAQKDSRIKYYACEHKGVSAARNLGLRTALGEYVAFVDSDDYVDPNIYETLLSLIEETGSDVCVCGFQRHAGGKVYACHVANAKTITYPEFQLAVATDESTGGYMFNKLYKKSLIASHAFQENLSVCEDFAFNFMIPAPSTCRVTYCPKAPYHYVHNPNGLTGSHQFFSDGVFLYQPAFHFLMKTIRDKKLLKALSRKYFLILRHSYFLLQNDFHKKTEQSCPAMIQMNAIRREVRGDLKRFLTSGLSASLLLSLIRIAFFPVK